jgi:ATP-dependent Clp protease ATP-binding subunit ClpX
MAASRQRLVTCSFCGKSQAEVKKIIAGPSSIHICDRCVGVCAAIIARADNRPITPPLPPVLAKSVDDAEKILFFLRELKKENVITEEEYRAKARLLVDFKDAGGSQKDGKKVSFSKSKKSNS